MGPASLPAAIISLTLSVLLLLGVVVPSMPASASTERSSAATSAIGLDGAQIAEFDIGTRWLRIQGQASFGKAPCAVGWSLAVSASGIRGGLTRDASGLHPVVDLRGLPAALAELLR